MPQMGGQPRGYRNAHINKVSFDENGVIQNITGDYAGVPQLKHVDPYRRVEAETIGWNGGISTERSSEPGGMASSVNLAVASIDDGDWTAVSKVDFGAGGAGTFTAKVASGSNGGTLELHIDRADGPLIGTLPISNTGGANSWMHKTASISGAAGVHDLYMVYKGQPTGNLFKVDYWQFEPKSDQHELAAIHASIDKYKFDIVPGTNEASLKVIAIYTDGTSEDVTAAAAATPAQNGIASVSNGVVTAIGYGATSIGISYGGLTDTVHMLVKDLNTELAVKQITVDKGSVALDTGATASFKVTAEYLDGHTEDVTRSAVYSNPSPHIADVANGTITAKASGTTQVAVSYQGAVGDAATAYIHVTVDTPAVIAIEAETAAEGSSDAYVYGTINDHTWSLVDGQSTQAMLFGPDTGFNSAGTDAASLAADSRLGYKINIASAGVYKVWILTKSNDYSGDSVHVGLDNEYKFTANGIHGVSGGQFKWANLSGNSGGIFGGAALNMTVGEHELNFWGREDGLAIDRIILTTSTSDADPVWPTVDRTAPTTTDNAPADWVNHDVTVDLAASDMGSGVAATYYSLDGGAEKSGTTVNITEEGVHSLIYWSVDNAGNVETAHTATVRIDKTAPELNIALDKTELWPANHKLVPATASVDGRDGASGIDSVVLTSIASSEVDAVTGDDDPSDIQDAEFGVMDGSFSLRAERSGEGSGRIYTITYTATDNAGNQTVKSVTVTVPHDQSGK